jgi:hypothetical protein
MEDRASISSTRVRQTLQGGDVAGAIPLLGRPFALDLGLATAGPSADQEQSFTTPGHMLLPRQGWYAGLARLHANTYGPVLVRIDDDTSPHKVQLYPRIAPQADLEVELLHRLADLPDLDDTAGGLAAAQHFAATWERPVFPPAGSY